MKLDQVSIIFIPWKYFLEKEGKSKGKWNGTSQAKY